MADGGVANLLTAGVSASAEPAEAAVMLGTEQHGAGPDAAAVRSLPMRVAPGGGVDGDEGAQSRAASPPRAGAATATVAATGRATTPSALPSPAASGGHPTPIQSVPWYRCNSSRIPLQGLHDGKRSRNLRCIWLAQSARRLM